MTKKRVVITGVGTVNPCGNNVQDYWDALIAGQSGIQLIDRFDVSDFTTKIAGPVKNLDIDAFLDKKEARRTSRFIIYGYAAALEAVKQANLDIHAHANDVGVEIGSGIGGIEVLEQNALSLHTKGPSKVSPFTVPMMIVDMASGFISIKVGAKGPNSAAVSACASANHAMGNSLRMIQSGQAKAMITGGAESALCPVGLASFCAARSLSTDNENPTEASRPFELNRSGFVMGEGAGILVFEELEFAKQRGATILGEVVGFGSSGDSYHLTAPAPEGEGAKRAIDAALKENNLSPTDIDYINAHGTSTKLNDKNETAAIKTALGEHAYNIPVSSTKSMTGHLLGAAGAIELIACLKSIETNQVAPTINYQDPDPDCDLNYVPNSPIERNINVAMSNSFGFGGHNAVIIVKRYN